jgi:hypothetical protein
MDHPDHPGGGRSPGFAWAGSTAPPAPVVEPARPTHLNASSNDPTPLVGHVPETSGGLRDPEEGKSRLTGGGEQQMASAGNSGQRAARTARQAADSRWIERTDRVGLAAADWSMC